MSNRLKTAVLFIAMVLATAASGLIAGFGTGWVLANLWSNAVEGWGGLIGAVVGFLLFYPVGVFLGQVIFKLFHFRGSLLLGLAGIFAGALVSIVANAVWHNPNVLIGGLIVLIPLLGTAGYLLGRARPREIAAKR